MKPISDDELRLVLEGLRPEPRPAFAAELDARVAAGFPRRSRAHALSPVLDWLRALKPRQILLPAGGTALAAIVAIAVVIGTQSSDTETSTVSRASKESSADSLGFLSMGGETAEPQAVKPFADESAGAAEGVTGTNQTFDGSGDYLRADSNNLVSGDKRAIERSSQITLGTEPEQVGKASSEVFDVVHDYRGVVLRSQTSDGNAAHAEAEFELLIPSGKVGDAMAAFSRIAEVRSRHEATNDITAPTVSAAEHLEDSRARIDSLLGQLAAAETEGEREAVERELREERSRAAAIQVSLDNLERRASLSRVSLRIVGGEGISSDGGGAWGIGDAFDDAGQILAVAAAVSLLALAVLGPIALIALLIWLARRTYLRRSRQTALG